MVVYDTSFVARLQPAWGYLAQPLSDTKRHTVNFVVHPLWTLDRLSPHLPVMADNKVHVQSSSSPEHQVEQVPSEQPTQLGLQRLSPSPTLPDIQAVTTSEEHEEGDESNSSTHGTSSSSVGLSVCLPAACLSCTR